ncbi:sugar phosphate isomerase/epimerase [Ruminococcaceae bacterium OttesenSCG-928-D13]|nr:sugar phosphate isomerase/epimerase [Ruminococcaceae bacterium OttesenSCG-928-D13]
MSLRLAMSQIGWEPGDEMAAMELLREAGCAGLEIAPTRVAGPHPYDDREAAANFAAGIRRAFGLSVCSMQSIWYGQAGSIFGPEREALLEYTKGAVRFAEAAGCGNLVFGCPKNRVLPEGQSPKDALPFFKAIGDFAADHGAVIALEPNPPLYGTNFINTTAEALAFVAEVDSPGLKVNLDTGTMIENGEAVAALAGHVTVLNHVHISEPNLEPIQRRDLHTELAALLAGEGYGGFVSIEMRARPLADVKATLDYVAEVFG